MSELKYTYTYIAPDEVIQELVQIQSTYRDKGYNVGLSDLLDIIMKPLMEKRVAEGIEFLKINAANIEAKERP